MSFGKKIASIFVELDETENTATSTSPAPVSNNSEIGSYQPKSATITSNPSSLNSPKKNEKIYGIIKEVLRHANLPGPDYMELIDLAETLQETMGVDADKAFNSAYKTLSKQGLTKDVVISSAKHYLDILKKEKQEFTETMNKNISVKIDSPKSEIETLNKTNADLQSQIDKLSQQIAQNKIIISNRQAEIDQATASIEENRQGFEYTLSLFENEINHNLENVQKL